jgi:hypothetical protein
VAAQANDLEAALHEKAADSAEKAETIRELQSELRVVQDKALQDDRDLAYLHTALSSFPDAGAASHGRGGPHGVVMFPPLLYRL